MAIEAQPDKPPTPWKRIMGWVGVATALFGFIAGVSKGVTWYQNQHTQHAELDAQMALAQTQAKSGGYSAAVHTYATILTTNPLYRPALDQQLDATMQWVENFSVVAPAGQSATPAAAPELDQIFGLLEAGLTRTKGTQAADIQAHLGWAHWLNQHIAEREFGPTAEQDLRAALQTDPSNVYANAMLGNWMLQTGGNFAEAVAHLNTAASTGKDRPFVRRMQLGGLIFDDKQGARAEVLKAANDMRKANEPLAEERKQDILSFCCNPTVTTHAELIESLSAVPPDEARKTYLWLDDAQQEGDDAAAQQKIHDFIDANILEISGKRPDAMAKYRALQQQLKDQPGSLLRSVDEAVARLSHG